MIIILCILFTFIYSRGSVLGLLPEFLLRNDYHESKLNFLVSTDKEIVSIFTQISVTKREAEIKLDETDFYEKKMINKRKKLILEGKDDDEIEEILGKRKKRRKPQKSDSIGQTVENEIDEMPKKKKVVDKKSRDNGKKKELVKKNNKPNIKSETDHRFV